MQVPFWRTFVPYNLLGALVSVSVQLAIGAISGASPNLFQVCATRLQLSMTTACALACPISPVDSENFNELVGLDTVT
eukprot:2786442-Amphidinium_carterae.1